MQNACNKLSQYCIIASYSQHIVCYCPSRSERDVFILHHIRTLRYIFSTVCKPPPPPPIFREPCWGRKWPQCPRTDWMDLTIISHRIYGLKIDISSNCFLLELWVWLWDCVTIVHRHYKLAHMTRVKLCRENIIIRRKATFDKISFAHLLTVCKMCS